MKGTLRRKWLLAFSLLTLGGLTGQIAIASAMTTLMAESTARDELSLAHLRAAAVLKETTLARLDAAASPLALAADELAARGADAGPTALLAAFEGRHDGDVVGVEVEPNVFELASADGSAAERLVLDPDRPRGWHFAEGSALLYAVSREHRPSRRTKVLVGHAVDERAAGELARFASADAEILSAAVDRDSAGLRRSFERTKVRGVDVFRFAASWDDDPSAPGFVLSAPAHPVAAPARALAAGMSVAGALLFAVLLLIWNRLIARFTRPLTDLAEAAGRVGAGDFSVRVPELGEREISALQNAFNAMAATLEESRARAIQSEKLAAVGRLAGGLAHEINNPIAIILGFAQGLDRRVAVADPLRRAVDAILRESLRCRALTRELLTFSRVAKRSPEVIDVNETVRATVVLLDGRAKSEAIDIVQELGATPLAVLGNSNQLQQILVNLGANALDSMGRGGRLTLRTRRRGDFVELEVIDTGQGVPEEARARLFEPFFTTKEVGKGTGLGLSLVHEIVQQHQGVIEIDSEVGSGTVVRVHLPLTAHEQIAAMSSPHSGVGPHS